MLEEVLLEYGGKEVSAMDVYKTMFKLGEGFIQIEDEEPGYYKTNPIAYWKNESDKKGHFRIMFEDTFKNTLIELQEADFAILNGITYFGRRNTQINASKMYSMIFDLDGIDDKKLENFITGSFNGVYPIPNYIILSGHGVHLYYIFEYGISLYPYIKIQLKNFKYALTEKLWNQYTSNEKKQFQGINQGFRVIGGKTKIEGVKVRAFEFNTTPFNLENLGEYIPVEYRIDESKLFRESSLTLEEAKRRYPKWYQKRIIEGNNEKGHWTCKPDLYYWWLKQIKFGTTYGHRYFSLMCLSIYAVKSGISFETLEKDAMDLIPFLNSLNPLEPFTKEDCISALECYDTKYCTFPIKDIIKLSGIEILKNKRNRRPQELHLKLARSSKKILKEEGVLKKEGRPSLEKIVIKYMKEHPDETNISKISRDCGISRKTVYKYFDKNRQS